MKFILKEEDFSVLEVSDDEGLHDGPHVSIKIKNEENNTEYESIVDVHELISALIAFDSKKSRIKEDEYIISPDENI